MYKKKSLDCQEMKKKGGLHRPKKRERYIYICREKKKMVCRQTTPPPWSSSYSSPSIPLLTFKFFTYIHDTTNRNASTKGVGGVGGWVMGGAKENTPIAPAWWPSELGPKKTKKEICRKTI